MRSPLVASTALCLAAIGLAACGSSSTPAAESASSTASSAALPECSAGASLIEQTEGPYYTPGAPERTDITDDAPGTPMLLTGYVLDRQCQPVVGATLDFWQADGQGAYDNTGFVLRGIQTTDSSGAYTLNTVIPGQYPGRTEHIHVKVTPPGGPTYTTQLYLPDSPTNAQDRIYVPGMEITIVSASSDTMTAAFDFVLPGGAP